ncbi:ankyrin repeat domain-containing protein [Ulvibacterium marinum]|uniref:ankyrin repeat domain-containing protein n=1 Tax=Ulvibacterium marinum TaxID=2419782 RepID=UPI00249493B9|nr:ankyrin repeat domain-containing protein [Ulvibacterium marinum]
MNNKKILLILLLLTGLPTMAQNLFRTTCQGNLDKLDSLLNYQDINLQDNRGRSLLHWALGCKKKEAFDFLIEKGIDINLEDNEKRTPMYVAVNFNDEYSFDRLQKLQPNNSWVQNYGTALLERAVLNKDTRFVEKLVRLGIDSNTKNERGSTPLEIAKRLGADDIYGLLLSLGADESEVRSIVIKGEYMGQKPPGTVPKLFAPNFISTEESEFGSVFNTEGTEFYFGVDVNGKSEIRYSKVTNNQWSKPETIFSHERYGYNDPFLSNDENRLYFISKRAMDGIGEPKDVDIWYAEKEKKGWSQPINAGKNINTKGNEYYISFTKEGSLYFSSNGHNPNKTDYDIYYSRFANGTYQKPVVLNDNINTADYEADVFVSPDESYIIFCSTRVSGYGRGDLYISFKDEDGTWTKAVNMGEAINTRNYEYCPFVTKDGKYLFYTSNQDIYWVSTEVIHEIKENSR